MRKYNLLKYFTLLSFLLFIFSCAAPLKTDTVSFMPPSAYPEAIKIDGLELAVIPFDSVNRCVETFGTDLKDAEIIPFHLVVQNNGTKEFEINHSQIFAIKNNGEYTVAYNLNKAAENVRSSSIGTTAVTNAVAGAVAGAVVGGALGAAVGGDSQGAETGAIIGGTVGASSGAAAGLSDSYTVQFKKELANLAFENKVIYPGDIQQGFIYFKWKNYSKIRIKLFNITDNLVDTVEIPTSIHR